MIAYAADHSIVTRLSAFVVAGCNTRVRITHATMQRSALVRNKPCWLEGT